MLSVCRASRPDGSPADRAGMTASDHQTAPAPAAAALAIPGLFTLAWPIFAEQALHLATGITDTLLASHISDEAVGGLGSAWQIIYMLMLVFNVLAVGSSIVISHHLGTGDAAGARRMVRGAVATNLWIGLVFSVGVGFAAPTLLRWAQLPPGPMGYALPFMQWMGGTLFLESMNFGLSAALRAHGRTREVMWTMLAQNVFNAAVSAVLMFGLLGAPAMGVTGVAVATACSRALACAALWWFTSRHIGYRFRLGDLVSINRRDLGRLLHFGVPAVIENMSWFGAFILITALTARMGAQTLATQAYVMQVATVVMLFGASVGLGNEILVGRLVGAGEFDAAYHRCLAHMKLGLIWTTVFAAAAALAGPWLIRIFSADPVIVQTGILLIAVGVVLEPGRSFNLILITALRACGDTRFPLVMGLLSQWGLMAFGGWFFGTHLGWGLPGVWLAFVADEWVRGLLMLRRWRQRRWVGHARAAQAQAQRQGPLSVVPEISPHEGPLAAPHA